MKQILRAAIFTSLLMVMAIGVFPVAAQITTVDKCGELGIVCGDSSQDVMNYIKGILNIFLALIGIVAVIFIIYAGVHLVTAQGDTKKAEEAKRTILYAIIGLVIIGLAAAIANFTIAAIQRS